MLLHRFPWPQCWHKERFLPTARNPGGTGELGWCWPFFMPRPEVWTLAVDIKMDKLSKQYTAFTVGNLGFFKCDCMPFWLCNAPATFQRLMQNCLGELNLTYCLIYLDNIVVFSQTAEEHLHHLCFIFDQFREHNLKLKPSKCSFFREEITYLAH